MRWLAILLLGALVGTPCHAEWVFVEDNGQNKYYVNTEGVERFSGFNRVWVKIVPPGPTERGWTHSVGQYDFAIDRALNRPYYVRTHKVDGSVETSSFSIFEENDTWLPTAPDEVWYSLWKICSKL